MTRLLVPDMSCGHCAGVITRAVKALDPAAQLSFDMPARALELSTVAPIEQVRAALEEEGYPATVAP